MIEIYEKPKNHENVSWDLWNRPVVFAVDLDGTLLKNNDSEWKGKGHFFKTNEKVKKIVDYINELKNTWIMIWTCRNDKKSIAKMLNKRKIPFDSINGHPFEPDDISRKVPYDILYDDRVFRYENGNEDDFLSFFENKFGERARGCDI